MSWHVPTIGPCLIDGRSGSGSASRAAAGLAGAALGTSASACRPNRFSRSSFFRSFSLRRKAGQDVVAKKNLCQRFLKPVFRPPLRLGNLRADTDSEKEGLQRSMLISGTVKDPLCLKLINLIQAEGRSVVPFFSHPLNTSRG